MIVRMKRVDLLCLEGEKDAALRDLRDLGFMHICAGKACGGESIERAAADLNRLERLLEAIPAHRGRRPSGLPTDELIQRGCALLDERRRLEEDRQRLWALEAAAAPFGEFSPEDARALETRGIPVRLYRCGHEMTLRVPAETVVRVLGEEKGSRFFAVIGRHRPDPGWVPVPLPAQSLNAVRAELRATADRLWAVGAELAGMGGDRMAIGREITRRREELDFQRVRAGTTAFGRLVHLRGYCPASDADRLGRAAGERGWGLVINEPAPDEIVPTLIRNPAWVRPFETVMDAIGLVPGYREFDMSPALMVFFSIFFAMIVGDAGYGVLCLGLATVLRRKFQTAPPGPFRLMWILGGCTVIWGIIGGNYFGWRAPWHIRWMDAEEHVVALCFLIGAVHLTLAHLWNAIRLFPSAQVLAQIGWIISTWTMYFAALSFILGDPFPHWMIYPFAIGLGLILLFMTPWAHLKADWHNHLVFPLAVVGNFGDVVSYVRLFAVGLAGYQVASNFNHAAWKMGHEGWVGCIGAVLLLFIAHGMNIALSALGVVVHGVRLNALEFSSHLGVQWAGVRYVPFARRVAPDDAHLEIAATGR